MTGVVLKHALSERGNDLYETPKVAVEALLRVERLPHQLWDPCSGPGNIVDVLRAHGHQVIGSDLVDYGRPDFFSGRDFLMEHKAPDGCEAIVMNAPFKLAAQFAAHAIELCPRVVMLLPLTFLEAGTGKARKDILRRKVLDEIPPARIHQFAARLPMMHRANWNGRKASSTKAYAWFVWVRGHTGATATDRILWTPDEAAAVRALAREAKRPPVEANQFVLALTDAEVPALAWNLGLPVRES